MSTKKIIKVKKFENYLYEIYGYSSFRYKQREIIEAIVKQKSDVCCVMATGHGKSICYQLPAIITKKPSLIISPLLSLMEDQRNTLEKLGVKTCCYNSTVKNKYQLHIDILNGVYQIIYTTPETVINLHDLIMSLHKQVGICVIAIDEAHCVSLWGNTFRSSYLQLSCLREWLPKVPILALTGTATPTVETDIINLLKLSNPVMIRTGSDRPNLSFYVHLKTNPLSDLLPHLLSKQSTIIYCQTRKDTEKFAEILKNNGVLCNAYHAGLANEIRNEIHHEFIEDKINCIVATISFGMGIDKKNIRQIIHYGCPKDVESYYQEIGRGGRDGQPSQCHVYYSPSDFTVNRSFLKDVQDPTMRKYKETMISAIEKYLYTTVCRRQILLEYFGETIQNKVDVCCDNCLSASKIITIDVGQEVKLFMELVSAFSGKSGRVKLINVIRGSNGKDIPQIFKNHHNFGLGRIHSLDWWKNCTQYIINDGLVSEKMMSSGFGSVLLITGKGIKWLTSNSTQPSFKVSTINEQLTEKSPKLVVDKQPRPEKSPKLAVDQQAPKTQTKINDMLPKTQIETYDLFRQGFTVKEIAQMRNLTTRTIEDHLASCLEHNLQFDVTRLAISKEIYEKIATIIDSDAIHGDTSKLSPIKHLCPSSVTYAQIKCIIAIKKTGGYTDKHGNESTDTICI
jgi:Werner syndrome ATP-dependent helicase